MRLTTLLTLLLGTASLASAFNASAPNVATKNSVVTLVNPDENMVYERLGVKHFHIGVGFQVIGLLCMGLVVCVTVGAQVKEKEDADNNDWMASLMAFLEILPNNSDFAKFVFTVLGYIVLDSLFKATFAGDPLMVYTVNTTFTGMTNVSSPEVYGVIASSAQAALGESCSQFAVHNPECSEDALLMNPVSLEFCKNDPLVTSQIYFGGVSSHALSFAFVLGCLLSALLNFVDLLKLFGGGWIVEGLLAALTPRTADGAVVVKARAKPKKGDGIVQQTSNIISGTYAAVTDAKKHDAYDPAEYVVVRFQILIRMALDGLAYGLMMMILEVQVDDDCVDMQNMLPINLASIWAYTIICACCSVIGMFFVLSAIELVSQVCNLACGKKHLMEEPTPLLKCLSGCFAFFVIVLVFISFLAYVYSIVLSFFLAYYVPGDSAIVIGCILTVLSMGTELVNLYDPRKADLGQVEFTTCRFKYDDSADLEGEDLEEYGEDEEELE